MLLISPRRLARSRNTSCSTPFSTTAARASCVLALTRISVLIDRRSSARDRRVPDGDPGRIQQCRGFEQRQSHDAGIAALQIRDEYGRITLDRIAARLVARLPRIPVSGSFGGIEGAKSNPAAADLDLVAGG